MKLTDQIEEVTPVAEKKPVDEGTPVQLIVFKLSGEEYALPIHQVTEIVLTPRISEVPQTPDYVRGIANIRGNVITMMDLERKFGLKSRKKLNGTQYTLVIESDDHKIGVMVNEVPSTLSIMSSRIDGSANIMQYASLDESIVKGVAKIDERMIILIDIHKMIEVGELKTQLE